MNKIPPFINSLFSRQLGSHDLPGPEVCGEDQHLGGGGGEAGQAVRHPSVQERVDTPGLNVASLQHDVSELDIQDISPAPRQR